jgi:hypothetical protein
MRCCIRIGHGFYIAEAVEFYALRSVADNLRMPGQAFRVFRKDM